MEKCNGTVNTVTRLAKKQWKPTNFPIQKIHGGSCKYTNFQHLQSFEMQELQKIAKNKNKTTSTVRLRYVAFWFLSIGNLAKQLYGIASLKCGQVDCFIKYFNDYVSSILW